jgi:leucyl-tRNA synthetase
MIRGEDGQKMSKSRGNVINPDDVVKAYGADSFRLYEMFMGPLDKSKPWNTKGLQGCYRFLQKVWRLFTENLDNIESNCDDDQTIRLLHQTIKKVTEDLSDLRFNTSVSQLMILVNHLSTLEKLDKDILETFLILLNPFSPHISEELYAMLGNEEHIESLEWPEWEESLVSSEVITLVVQFNGKRRGEIEIEKDLDKKDLIQEVKTDKSFDKYFSEMEIIKEIYVENRLVNFVVKPQ